MLSLNLSPERDINIVIPKHENFVLIIDDFNRGKIIIDARYYRETLATWYDREKIHSQNLYQLFSYLLNQQRTDCPDSFKTRGILIYPDTGKEINLDYWYDKHLIQIKTLNLNVNWREIEGRLRGVV